MKNWFTPFTPSGFHYFANFLTLKEEKLILNEITKFSWQVIKMHGVTAKRRVMHFGLDYSYTTRDVNPTIPIPIFLQPFIEKSAVLMKVSPFSIVEILITEYPAGAGIGWHKDAPIFGDKVFGISLGAACVFKLRSKENNDKKMFKIELKPGSAYILSRLSRTHWEHSISPVKELRYSITFRILKS